MTTYNSAIYPLYKAGNIMTTISVLSLFTLPIFSQVMRMPRALLFLSTMPQSVTELLLVITC